MDKMAAILADAIFKCIFLNENVWISIKISLKDPFNNIPPLFQLMAWCRPDDKPLSEPVMARLPMHICITQPEWIKGNTVSTAGYFMGNTVHIAEEYMVRPCHLPYLHAAC